MRSARSTTARLVAARPPVVDALDELVGADERAELLERILASEATAPAPVRSRRRRPRRARIATALVGAAAASLVATTLGARLWPGQSPRAARPAASRAETAQLLAYVTSAVASVEGIVVIDSSNGGVRSTFWTSTGGGSTTRWRYSINGRPSYDQTITEMNGRQTITNVDFAAHAWWTEQSPSQCGQSSCQTFGPTPGQVVQSLRTGEFRITGHPVVHGRPTIELTATYPGFSGTYTLLVDTASYLPLQSVNSVNTSPFTTTYTYLPDTPANVALLQVPIPPGFRHAARPITCSPSQLGPHETTFGCP